jgi:hypothetical protein
MQCEASDTEIGALAGREEPAVEILVFGDIVANSGKIPFWGMNE